MAHIGLFFGSFNPIHVGHLIIASHFVENNLVDAVWFIVSPQNPFKEKKSLAPERHRFNMVQVAIDDNPKFRASDIEFKLPQPSYTIDTLTMLAEKFPMHNFSLIMGSDNLLSIHNWKNAAFLIQHYPILVFERPNHKIDAAFDRSSFKKITIAQAPLLEISASYIRACLQQKKSIRYLVPEVVIDYIDKSGLYKV